MNEHNNLGYQESKVPRRPREHDVKVYTHVTKVRPQQAISQIVSPTQSGL
jgi:hypothetical protein